MEPALFFTVFATFYLFAFFFDRFFKSCMHYPYAACLKETGLEVQFMRLRWHCTANTFNRSMQRLGNGARCWLNKSYTLGVLVTLLLLPLGIALLFLTIFNNGKGSANADVAGADAATAAAAAQLKIEILLPGLNLPLEEIGFYVSTLLLATLMHELGHALAAVAEDVPVAEFGFQLYFCFPLAYTEISMEHFNALKWLRKLRILCAGIWHNFLFAILSYLLLCSFSFLSKPFYTLNEHVILTELTATSPLNTRSQRGLQPDNIITQINDCKVLNEQSWFACLHKALRHKPGYCISSDFIHLNDESIAIPHHGDNGLLQCCDEQNTQLCCFEYIEDLSNDAPVQIPQHMCLHVRRSLEAAAAYCHTAGSCDSAHFCLRPLLHNSTTIFSIKRLALPDVLYIGHPADIIRTVRISPFVPKQSYVAAQWADNYCLFLKYNIVFSIGLALINSIPCFGFDGYHITNTILNTFLVNRIAERSKRDVIALIVTGIGTLFFGIAISKVLWLSFLRHLF